VVSARIPVDGGAFTLEAEAELRPGAPGAVVCHPHPAFGGRMDTPLVLALADALADAGLSTVRFNFRGIDGSDGTPTGGHLEQDDVRAASAWLRAQGCPRVALVGYSFGALMAMKALAAGEPAAAYAGVAFPTTILGDRPERVADLERALDRGLPWLFVQGDRDQFCELARIEASGRGRPHVRIETVQGGHFFAGPAADDIVARVTTFVRQTLSSAQE
jgi:alpha/beta superfamily hydrolase